MGRSKGGFSSKIHVACVDELHVIEVRLTSGQAGDAPVAGEILQCVLKIPQVESVIADRAYDANSIRSQIKEAGKCAVIPSTRNRKIPLPYSKTQYKERNRVERFMNRIKQYRAIATRYDKLAVMFVGLLTLTLIAISCR